MAGKIWLDQANLLVITNARICEINISQGESNLYLYWFGNKGEIFFKSSANMRNNHCNHCAPDSGHIPRMRLVLPWSQSDNNNNSAIFVRLLNIDPKSPGSLSAARDITDGSI